MNEQDSAELRAELRVMKREVEAMHADVKKLIEAEAERRGREKAFVAAAAQAAGESHERSAWWRMVIPVGAVAGIASALAWLRQELGIGQ
jgi:negative regulator of sigma E activity